MDKNPDTCSACQDVQNTHAHVRGRDGPRFRLHRQMFAKPITRPPQACAVRGHSRTRSEKAAAPPRSPTLAGARAADGDVVRPGPSGPFGKLRRELDSHLAAKIDKSAVSPNVLLQGACTIRHAPLAVTTHAIRFRWRAKMPLVDEVPPRPACKITSAIRAVHAVCHLPTPLRRPAPAPTAIRASLKTGKQSPC